MQLLYVCNEAACFRALCLEIVDREENLFAEGRVVVQLCYQVKKQYKVIVLLL